MDNAPSSLIPDVRECAILLDVDGTILDMAPEPWAVEVPASLRDTLARLITLTDGAVALVSGRSLDDLHQLFSPLRLPAVGGHGAEILLPANDKVHQRRSAPLDEKLRRKLATAADIGSGILVEDKGYSVAVHYRLAPDLERVVYETVSTICAGAHSASIEILPGKYVLEVKPTGFSKGKGVRDLMSYRPFAGRYPIFIGDDITDESVFAIIPEYGGRSYSVGRYVAGNVGYFEAPSTVRHWLARIADKAESNLS
jgi:trehalose 6-phosphate phosphatase